MKLFKKYFVTVALVFAMLIACVAFFGSTGQNAQALSPDYTGTQNTIYYFYDLYPTISPERLTAEFGTYTIVYDRQISDQQYFTTLVNNGYFSGFAEACVVIIDIKTFKPSPAVLLDLFYSLKEEQMCVTAFATVYAQNDYSETDFLDYVDSFLCVNFDALDHFFDFVISDFDANALENADPPTSSAWDRLAGCVFLLDNREICSYATLIGSQRPDIVTLCAASPYLTHFLERLANYIDPNHIYSIPEIAEKLMEQGVKLLVYVPDYNDEVLFEFVDILTWTRYTSQQFQDEILSNPVCALGIWSFTHAFYQYLCNIWQPESTVFIYAMKVDPIIYDPEGLPVRVFYYSAAGASAMQEELLGELHDLLDND